MMRKLKNKKRCNSIRIQFYFILFVLISCCFILLQGQQQAQTTPNGPILKKSFKNIYRLQIVVDKLDIPWGMEFLPDGSILITEKAGQIIHFKKGKKIFIKNIPKVNDYGQGGLLDIKLHPQYKTNGWIYISYTSTDGGSGYHTAIMRAKLKGEELVEQQILYKASPNTDQVIHYGSRIEFDNKGFLFFSIGDRFNTYVNPQDITKDGGKIYRLKDDGTIPESNPFYKTLNAKGAIYSYGHRNPQGLIKHPLTGEIWEHEHGPQGGDEINIIKAGKNYGWPEICYCINYDNKPITNFTHKNNMEQPTVYYWLPSIAPCGMAFVYSKRYPAWKGDLLIGSLKFQYLEKLSLQNNKVIKREKLFDNYGRVRNVKQAPDGYIYVAIEGKGIYRIN